MSDPSQPVPIAGLTEALYLHGDVESMARILTSTLAGLLPADLVTVQYRRGARDRLSGRPGTPVAVDVLLGDRRLSLRSGDGAVTQATISHVVRGVTLSTEPVAIGAWITTLATELERMAAADQRARTALENFLLG